MTQTVSIERAATHEEVLKHLKEEGFYTDWVNEHTKSDVDDLDTIMKEDEVPRTEILEWLEVEGQCTDGAFEDPRSEYDFTRLLVEDPELPGRMLYYMKSVCGLEYSYEDLINDIQILADMPYYNAPFSQRIAKNNPPKKK